MFPPKIEDSVRRTPQPDVKVPVATLPHRRKRGAPMKGGVAMMVILRKVGLRSDSVPNPGGESPIH